MFGLFTKKRCRIHGRDLRPDNVPIRYGLIRLPSNLRTAQRRLFPNANTSVLGGCRVGPKKFRDIFYCPDCRAAESKWREENPEFDTRSAVYISVQSQRRELPDTLGKQILRQSELKSPERAARYQWIVYRISLDQLVLYNSRDKTYTFPHGASGARSFSNVQELADHVTDRFG